MILFNMLHIKIQRKCTDIPDVKLSWRIRRVHMEQKRLFADIAILPVVQLFLYEYS